MPEMCLIALVGCWLADQVGGAGSNWNADSPTCIPMFRFAIDGLCQTIHLTPTVGNDEAAMHRLLHVKHDRRAISFSLALVITVFEGR